MLPTTSPSRANPDPQVASESVLEAERYELQHNLSFLLCVLYRDIMSATERRTKSEGMTAAQWRFMRTLFIEDGINQRELSRRVGLREPTTTRAIIKLEELGMVRREADPANARKVLITLTESGRRQVSALIPQVCEINEAALAGLDESETQQFKALLLRAIRNVQRDIAC